MIIREHEEAVYLIAQPAHAYQCAQLAVCLQGRFLGEVSFRRSLLKAIQHHDDGWIDYEEKLNLDEEGLPQDFLNTPPKEHRDIWVRSIFQARLHHGEFASALIARHAAYLSNEQSSQDFQELSESLWQSAIGEKATLESLNAYFFTLFFTDAVSLFGLTQWQEPKQLTLFDFEKSATVDLVLKKNKDQHLTIEPWPFHFPRITEIKISAKKMTREQLKGLTPKGLRGIPDDTFSFSILPGEGTS